MDQYECVTYGRRDAIDNSWEGTHQPTAPAAWHLLQYAPAVRILLGVFPVQRLNACVNALTS